MSTDSPTPEPARARRSARITAPADVPAATSRAEARRRAAAIAALPDRTVVSSAPEADAATSVAVPPMTRRRARELRARHTSTTGTAPAENRVSSETAVSPAQTETAVVLAPAARTAVIAVPAEIGPALHAETGPIAPEAPIELIASPLRDEDVVVAPASVIDLEPAPAVRTAPTDTAAPQPDPRDGADHDDPFTAAAHTLAFTPPTIGEPEPADATAAEDSTSRHRAASRAEGSASRTRRTGTRPAFSAKRIVAATTSLSAIAAVGLLAVGATLPAAAIAAPDQQNVGAPAVQQLAGDVKASAGDKIQAYVAPAAAASVEAELDRTTTYSTASLVELAGTVGISNFSDSVFTNNVNCPVQWPFAVGVPMSYGYGPRPGEFHTGDDFTPGDGAHVQAIADGVVRVAQEGYQGYGVAVIIDHVIDGKKYSSLYGHMQYGSLQVKPGDHVRVGQYIGRTGDTGFSFGAHTHVEIRLADGSTIDPVPFLRAHNQC